jgi:hypothetical protein
MEEIQSLRALPPVSNTLIGWIGGFYEKMTPAEFWAMHVPSPPPAEARLSAESVLPLIYIDTATCRRARNGASSIRSPAFGLASDLVMSNV